MPRQADPRASWHSRPHPFSSVPLSGECARVLTIRPSSRSRSKSAPGSRSCRHHLCRLSHWLRSSDLGEPQGDGARYPSRPASSSALIHCDGNDSRVVAPGTKVQRVQRACHTRDGTDRRTSCSEEVPRLGHLLKSNTS